MRVGLDLLFLIPGETGGRETYARELIAAMLAREPSLPLTAFVNRDVSPAQARELGMSLRVRRVPVSARRPEQWAAGELALLPVAGWRAGVELMHSLANFGPASGPFRRVLTIHDLQYRAVPELLTTARRLGTAVQLSLAARRADRIIAVSNFDRKEVMRELGVAEERIAVIPNGIGVPAGEAEPEATLRARFALRAQPVCLSVATNLPHKNLPLLFAAVGLLPVDQRPLLVLAGGGTDSATLSQAAVAAGVSEDVRLLGHQPAPTLEGLYRLAACLVLPSRYEGFGLTALEAMTRGLPVACADIPALREVTGPAALRFSPDRPEQAADAIARLIHDRKLADRLRVAGRERAALFSWDAAARDTLACYRRALGGPDPEPPVPGVVKA
jgi:glycosyltransferase involved in cell wall biosynthesis